MNTPGRKISQATVHDAKPLVYSHGEYLGIGKKLGTFGYSVKKKKKKSGKKKQ